MRLVGKSVLGPNVDALAAWLHFHARKISDDLAKSFAAVLEIAGGNNVDCNTN